MAMDTCSFVDKTGARVEARVTLDHYQEAQRQGKTLRQYINATMPTVADSKYDSFTQTADALPEPPCRW